MTTGQPDYAAPVIYRFGHPNMGDNGYGDVVWPPIGPDVTGGQAEPDHAHKIPAQLCYENGPLIGLPFDPPHCYEGAPAADADTHADADANADACGGGNGSGCSCTLVSNGSRAGCAGGTLLALAFVLR